MDKILVVDDEKGIRDIIGEYLSAGGYIVDEAENGEMALDLFKKRENDYSAIILDVMMPQIDGWTVCKEIRKISDVPIIMLTARGEEYDRLFGFELGVDDYIVKPFSPKELLARLKAIVRRSNSNLEDKEEKIELPGVSIDISSRNVYVDGDLVKLTPKEFELLCFLTKHPRRVFSRDQILNEVWGYDFFGDARTVDTHIKMLRENLKKYRKYIVTVWGTGYKFELGVE